MIDFDVGKYGAFIWPAYAVTALNHARRWKRRAQELSGK